MDSAIYVVEFRSIARGIAVLDKMLKGSSLALLHADPICIGKYLICLGGDVADVREAQNRAEAPGEEAPLASYLLTSAHPAVLGYFRHGAPPVAMAPDAIGIFETRNAASGFISLDAALKSAQVKLLRLWLGQFLGGKYCYVLGGSTSDVESALAAATAALPEKEQVGSQLVPMPDEMTLKLFVKGGETHGPG